MKRNDTPIKNNKHQQIKFMKNLLEINKSMISILQEENKKQLDQFNKIILPAIKNFFNLHQAVRSINWTQQKTQNYDFIEQVTTESVKIDDIKVWLDRDTISDYNSEYIKRSIYSISDIKEYSKSLYNTLNNISALLSSKRDVLFLLGHNVKIDFFKEKITIYNLDSQKITNFTY